jgi:hypothetical protein
MAQSDQVTGGFETIDGERYYAIKNVDRMPPFLVSLVSDSDHWMFVASNGGLTAGRESPETALFPYITVDRIYESTPHTGCLTLLQIEQGGARCLWEPFKSEVRGTSVVSRNLYKNALGNKLLYEEINHDLQLVFRYSWNTSREYGFVRSCELRNLGKTECKVEILDGLQNILPAGTPRHTQANASYLVDAYKWSELDEETGLALFTLYSGITDRAEPCESLRANSVFCLGLDEPRVLLSSLQVDTFRQGGSIQCEAMLRGRRGAYLANTHIVLGPGGRADWQIVANIEQGQVDVVRLQHELQAPSRLAQAVRTSVHSGSDRLAKILAAADGFQLTGEETVATHHCANVLFNTLRGGIFDEQYTVHAGNFERHLWRFNKRLHAKHESFISGLPETLNNSDLIARATQEGDPQLERIALEYLPITFGRRHGDPSRPWNQFAIKLFDAEGGHLLCYQGNWRDIFQNWEALLLSYPEYTEQIITKFVNATTADGYNPYRISESGIDWEEEDPEDPWSYIGYWGDHQIIYLQKLLELSLSFHPEALRDLLPRAVFSYANVPYLIKPFEALLEDAKDTVVYDHALAGIIDERVSELGADGRLLLDSSGEVLLVNFLEKLLVPLLSKLANLVVGGGIWLNTQRPEWNDANNALVGQGLSMVTLCYMRRYVCFMQKLLRDGPETTRLSAEVSLWLQQTTDTLCNLESALDTGPFTDQDRLGYLRRLGEAASAYRHSVYEAGTLSDPVTHNVEDIQSMLDSALSVIDQSIRLNLRPDGLYHAYNLLVTHTDSLEVDHLYPMLEGQVAALSSGAVAPAEGADILEDLFAGDLYRQDQDTFLLYPDRKLPRFLQKGAMTADQVEGLPIIARMLERGDRRIVDRDEDGIFRFNPNLPNARALKNAILELTADYGEELASSTKALEALYESVFQHRSFTGRAGGMFAFEGLGSIYWHMVAKLLLAAQELFFTARDMESDATVQSRLGSLYYRVRHGIGFNKSPGDYGAFPTDPYSHTPAHMGAQQPGMTGQVKEEIITRFGELGLRISGGAVRFDSGLLRLQEFATEPGIFRFLDVHNSWLEEPLPARSLAFTWCQVPFVYRLTENSAPTLTIHLRDGEQREIADPILPLDLTREISTRSGRVTRVVLNISREGLFEQ